MLLVVMWCPMLMQTVLASIAAHSIGWDAGDKPTP